MKIEWDILAVLPNISVRGEIGNGTISLVSSDNVIVSRLIQEHNNLKMFLENFGDEFSNPIRPSLIIYNVNSIDYLNVESFAAFRDAIAVSTVCLERAMSVVGKGFLRVNYTDYFDLYPWHLDKNFEQLVTYTPALGAVTEKNILNSFRGQRTSGLANLFLDTAKLDQPLLDLLLSIWHEQFILRRESDSGRALFRSLNMAFSAARLPAGSEQTIYDLGRSLALWVSALEILAYAYGNKNWASLSEVYSLLEDAPWSNQRLKSRRFTCYEGKQNGNKLRRPYACKLYGQLYQARNAFLHGKPVSEENLQIRSSSQGLPRVAASLYRAALSAFLQLKLGSDIPSTSDVEAFSQYCADSMCLDHYQEIIEESLLATLK